MRGGPARVIGALAAIPLALGLALAVSLTRPMPASACSGADPVTADDLIAHPGPILVVNVIQRIGRLAEQPRVSILGVEEALRGTSGSVLQLERPRTAMGVCHDLFTGTPGTRMLIALGVRTQGLVLTPAWRLTKDDTLQPIYDKDVPWATLADARAALHAPGATSLDATVAASGAWPIAEGLLGALAVVAVIVAAGWLRRARPVA